MPGRSYTDSMRLRGLLVALLAAAVSASCGEKRVALRMAVDVASEPANAEIRFRGKSLGEAPRAVEVATWADLADLAASKGDLETVEKRVRILSPERAQLLFRLGRDEVSPVAKRLGLARVLVFEYGESVSFDSDKAELKPEAFPVLDKQAEILGRYFPKSVVWVCGFTDATGGDDLNERLSLERAETVAGYLAARGVKRSRMRTRGFGKEFEVASNDTPDGRARNPS
jgi:outer membrane protein OmpA-like peptidoglycan-associated protein